MKLIVGLGNPNGKYKNNRHNVGFMVVDKFGSEVAGLPAGKAGSGSSGGKYKESKKGKLLYMWLDINGNRVEIIKPQTMMNGSGRSVSYALKNHPELDLDDVLVVHDDLDIPLGEYKLQKGRGAAGHKGVESVILALGSKEFWRLRVGVDTREFPNPDGGRTRRVSVDLTRRVGESVKVFPSRDGEDFVLSDFGKDERKALDELISEKLVGDINKWIGRLV